MSDAIDGKDEQFVSDSHRCEIEREPSVVKEEL